MPTFEHFYKMFSSMVLRLKYISFNTINETDNVYGNKSNDGKKI